jgi:hypothetical protein
MKHSRGPPVARRMRATTPPPGPAPTPRDAGEDRPTPLKSRRPRRHLQQQPDVAGSETGWTKLCVSHPGPPARADRGRCQDRAGVTRRRLPCRVDGPVGNLGWARQSWVGHQQSAPCALDAATVVCTGDAANRAAGCSPRIPVADRRPFGARGAVRAAATLGPQRRRRRCEAEPWTLLVLDAARARWSVFTW